VTTYLVGAGPGDPGLLTARALELIARADVVLHDRLVAPEALAHARPDAVVVDVGKVGGGEQVPQERTTALLVEHARAGREVVRLKGGDPFVFGRGGEEAQALRAAGCAFEIVPGVTAGVAAPAYAGIPVTQRGLASAVAFVTGHLASDIQSASRTGTGGDTQSASRTGTGGDTEAASRTGTGDLDWPALAAFPGTLVFYMGVRQLARIGEQLVAHGRDPDEPATVVERGTLADQRAYPATLATLGAVDARAPAVTVVGAVAALGAELAWFAAGPLAGRTIAVTRARAQASALAARLRALGARVVEAPAIRIEPLAVDLPDLAGYDLLCLTSPNGVRRLFEEVRDARALAGPTIAAIGPGTAAALREHGVAADVVPEHAVGEALVAALDGVPVRRALVARAAQARDVVPDALRARGAEVDVLALYRTVAEPLDPEARAAALGADYATFTSASSVRFFHAAAGTLDGPRLASIGPVTTAALRELGYVAALEAGDHTPEGLVAALVSDATG
jgi:uroporphyrinogen III methyltransferase/synthase